MSSIYSPMNQERIRHLLASAEAVYQHAPADDEEPTDAQGAMAEQARQRAEFLAGVEVRYLTEEEALAIDRAYSADKDSGALQRAADARALSDQIAFAAADDLWQVL